MKKTSATPTLKQPAHLHPSDNPLTPAITAKAKEIAGWIAIRKKDNQGQDTLFNIESRTYTARYFFANPRDRQNPSNVVLLRGPSGAGKSIFALELAKAMNATVVSADHHFTNAQGEYVFVKEELSQAHKEAHDTFLSCLDQSKSTVIDNTSTTPGEMKFYVQECKQRRIGVTIIDIMPNSFKEITVSKIPAELLAKKYEFLQKLPVTKLTLTGILNSQEPQTK